MGTIWLSIATGTGIALLVAIILALRARVIRSKRPLYRGIGLWG